MLPTAAFETTRSSRATPTTPSWRGSDIDTVSYQQHTSGVIVDIDLWVGDDGSRRELGLPSH